MNENANDEEDFSHALRIAQAQYSDNDENGGAEPSATSTPAPAPAPVSHIPSRRPSTPPLSYISEVVERLQIDNDDSEFETHPPPPTSIRHDYDMQQQQQPGARTDSPHHAFAPMSLQDPVGVVPGRFRATELDGASRHPPLNPIQTTYHERQRLEAHAAFQLTNTASTRGRGRGARGRGVIPATSPDQDDEAWIVGGGTTRTRSRAARGRGQSVTAVETPVVQEPQPRRASQRKGGKI